LRGGGAIIFPHAGIDVCGHQIAAAVHACLDCGADRVLAVGVLHALTQELEDARVRVAHGADVTQEASWGIQGPGLEGRQDWQDEFSLLNFFFLWEEEIKRRGIQRPELIVRYPYLTGGRPHILPGIQELQAVARDAVVVSTADPFHHGIGYGDPPESSLPPNRGGLELARRRIQDGLKLLKIGDYWGFNQHCVDAKSDGRDAGQVLRYLLGPLDGNILDIVADDMTAAYSKPAPTWVAGALIDLPRAASPERTIRETIAIQATLDQVWDAWTTETGIKSFFAPACNVALHLNGPYEIYFNPDAEQGKRGGEGNTILAFQPKTMLAFTWNAPPHLPAVRDQRTHVLIRLRELPDGRTSITLTHSGWGRGGEWDQAFRYFSRAWADVVLPRLAYRFSVGPIDWKNPPELGA
jgi:uncharacterized protein YndB with AHSA1/START domain